MALGRAMSMGRTALGLGSSAYSETAGVRRSIVMFSRWKQRQVASGAASLGYSRRRVDTFLAQIGAQHAHGIDAEVLTAAIRDVRFPLAPLGYNPAMIDRHLSELHDTLSNNVRPGSAVAVSSAA